MPGVVRWRSQCLRHLRCGWLVLILTSPALGQSVSPPEAITQFSALELTKSYHRLNQTAFERGAALRQAALSRIQDRDERIRYAAVYALAITANAEHDINELLRILQSGSIDERMLAAGALAGLGDKRGLPVLIDALDNGAELQFRTPPTQAREFARAQLLWFTTQDFGLRAAISPEQIPETKARWLAWWSSVGDTVRRDPSTRKFVQ